VDRGKLETLGTCAYVRARQNVLFLGPPGVGKSHCEILRRGFRRCTVLDTIW
jgi:stage III sporulation protein SpoIIIAA